MDTIVHIAADTPDPEPVDAEGLGAWLAGKAKKLGSEILEKALMAVYVVVDPKTPNGARTVMIAALAYLVLPADAVPDFIPVAGFADDLAALAAAFAAIADNVRVRHLREARKQMNDWGIDVDPVRSGWSDDARLSEYDEDDTDERGQQAA